MNYQETEKIFTKITLFRFKSLDVFVNQVYFVRCKGYDGGGILVNPPTKTLTVLESTFLECSADNGAAIYSNYLDTNNISKTCFNNCSTLRLGTLSIRYSILKQDDCVFYACTSNKLHAISIFNDNFTLNRCNISNENGNHKLMFSFLTTIDCSYCNLAVLYNESFIGTISRSDTLFTNTIFLSLSEEPAFSVFQSNMIFNNCSIIAKLGIHFIRYQNENITFSNCILQFDDFEDLNISYELNERVYNQTNVNFIDLNNITCYSPSPSILEYEIVSGKIISKYQLGNNFNILIKNAVFENINDIYKGGAFRINEDSITLEINSSSFIACTAQSGGAFYLNQIYQCSINEVCINYCDSIYGSIYVIDKMDSEIIQSLSSYYENPTTQFNQASAIVQQSNIAYPITFYNSNLSKNSITRKYSTSSAIILCSNFKYLYAIFDSHESYTYSIIPFSITYIEKSLFINNSMEATPSFLIKNGKQTTLIDTVFIKNSFNISLYELSKMTIINCTIDNMDLNNFTKTIGSTNYFDNLYLKCYNIPLDESKNSALIIGLTIGGVVILIIIIAIIIYACRMRKWAIFEKNKSELSQSIMVDFG